MTPTAENAENAKNAPAAAAGAEVANKVANKDDKKDDKKDNKIALRTMTANERSFVLGVAQDRRLPKAVREQMLSGYDVPASIYADDPGWGAKLGDAAIRVIGGIMLAAAGAVSLVLLIEASKGVLRSVGALPPAPGPLPETNPST